MKTTRFFIGAFLCLTLVTTFTSCSDDDDPTPVNPSEFITNVTLTFINTDPASSTDIITMTNVAPDGQEGSFTNNVSGSFTAGATYALQLTIEDRSNPAEVEDKLNEDIIPEADEHFFVYGLSNLNFTMTRDDNDVVGADNNKIGVETTWVAGAASTGNFNIVLVHEATDVDETANDNLGSATGGEEDFRITFENVTIQ